MMEDGWSARVVVDVRVREKVRGRVRPKQVSMQRWARGDWVVDVVMKDEEDKCPG